MILGMNRYPFEQRLRQLKLLGHLDSDMTIEHASNNEFLGFATQLGMAYSAGDEDMKKKILQVVRTGRLDGHSSHGSTLREPAEIEQGANESAAQPNLPMADNVTELGDIDLPRFTSILKEYGDQQGVAYSWPTRQVSTMPVRFRCVIQMEDRTCDGIARSKKDAKHLASRKACQLLGIEI